MKKTRKKLISFCSILFLLLISCNGCAGTPEIVYKDVPANTIILDGKAYDINTWGIYRRETIKNILETVIEKDEQLKECLERERIK